MMRPKGLLLVICALVVTTTAAASPQASCAGLLSLNLTNVEINTAELIAANKRD